VPEAEHRLGVTFLGVSTLLFDDGESAVLFDGFFSRPSLLRVGLGRIAPDEDRIDRALRRLGFGTTDRQIDAVVPVHSHYDHALDSAEVARRTGAMLVGSESTAQVGRGGGLPEDRIRVVAPGEQVSFGDWSLCFVESAHCPPDRFPGAITEPVVPPVRAAAYRCGSAWSVLVSHAGGRTALVQGSAGFVPGALDDCSAEVAYLGVGMLGHQSADYIRDYWSHTVRAVGARSIVLTHWDDFFCSLDRPLRPTAYAGDDLDITMSVLDRLVGPDESLHFPTAWRREDPWAPLGLNTSGYEEPSIAHRIRMCQERLDIIGALVQGSERRAEVLAVVEDASTPEEAAEGLVRLLGISPVAAAAILDMQWRRLVGQQRGRLVEERDVLARELAELRAGAAAPD